MPRFPAYALVLVLGSACGRDAAPGVAHAVGPPSEAERLRLREDIEAKVRDELTRELEPIIRAKVVAELKDELRREIRAELSREAVATRTLPTLAPPSASPDAYAGAGDTHDAPDTYAESPDGPSDITPGEVPIWSRPGTVIKPWRAGPKLLEVAAGTGLEDKAPTDVKLTYDKVPELLYCYTVFENPAPETTITHVWRRGTRLVSRVELEVGNSPKWKTWSKQRTQSHWTGVWSCEVLGPEGQQLGATAFQVGAP